MIVEDGGWVGYNVQVVGTSSLRLELVGWGLFSQIYYRLME